MVAWKQGRENLDGHEIGLSAELAHDLLVRVDKGDPGFDAEFAQRVRGTST